MVELEPLPNRRSRLARMRECVLYHGRVLGCEVNAGLVTKRPNSRILPSRMRSE